MKKMEEIQFKRLTKLFKEWFEFEEIKLRDGVCERLAITVQELFQSELKRERDFWLKELKWKGEK